ncbi:MAG: MFS transporter [Flammeovirgaceae bacterium]|nr:MFS transporter [Flammeovirgaceae bacterium]
MENSTENNTQKPDMMLFWGCFFAIVATAFGFIIRAMILDDLGAEFNLSNTQKGEIAGVGLWPFAISIVLFSLFIDKIGYKVAMIFAFLCQIISVVMTIYATDYWMLYAGTFVLALGNGAVEAFANPVVATIFSKDKTKWLNILHAGWAGGLVLGGVFALFLGPETSWELKVGLILIPVLVYVVMLIKKQFPVQERVQAGVSYLEMLKEVGIGGALIIIGLIIFQLGAVFNWSTMVSVIATIVIVGAFGFYVKSFGQPLFIFLLLIMIPLATTELGTDSWITDLMAPEMKNIGIQAGWILVYTSLIMVVLRFFAGSIIHKISPLGLLAVCSLIASFGLYFLSISSGVIILVAATVYGLGKAFFWPTMLGLVAERFPKGGALTLNITGGVGMIGVGVIGAVILGFVQDIAVDKNLAEYDLQNKTELHTSYVTEEKESIFGSYMGLDAEKLGEASESELMEITAVQEEAKKEALKTVAIFPIIMFLCYLFLIIYFKSKGGYKAVDLEEGSSIKQPA